ncbi:hypothetical protein ACMDCR_00725 [Labrys okinawensis]|uniref:hypothetical protein n=1 Tax=Labrys okinawensis TaxID=346911 RepID=UPI0039BD7574
MAMTISRSGSSAPARHLRGARDCRYDSLAEERASNAFAASMVRTRFSDDPAVMAIDVEFAYDGERWIEEISQHSW